MSDHPFLKLSSERALNALVKLVAAVYAHENDVAVVSKFYTETLIDNNYPPKVTAVLKGPRSESH